MKSLTIGLQFAYLLTTGPGRVRIIIVVLGVKSLVGVLLGYENDFSNHDSIINDTFELYVARGYGLGYQKEILNRILFAAVIICCISSIFFILFLMFITEAQEMKNMNRYIHLGLGFFLMIAWICGVGGLSYFRSNCCHIGNGRIYHKSPSIGYTQHCLCSLTVQWKLELIKKDEPNVNVTDTEVWSHAIYKSSERIISAAPHDFLPHCFALTTVFMMAFMYLIAAMYV